MVLAHGPLSQVCHDVLFHPVNVLLKVKILLLMLSLPPAVNPHPCDDDDGSDGNSDDEVDPDINRYRSSICTRLVICQFVPILAFSFKRKRHSPAS